MISVHVLAPSSSSQLSALPATVAHAYARFLIGELLPKVARRWRFAADPARRAIGGTSSGAICAFLFGMQRICGGYYQGKAKPAPGQPPAN